MLHLKILHRIAYPLLIVQFIMFISIIVIRFVDPNEIEITKADSVTTSWIQSKNKGNNELRESTCLAIDAFRNLNVFESTWQDIVFFVHYGKRFVVMDAVLATANCKPYDSKYDFQYSSYFNEPAATFCEKYGCSRYLSEKLGSKND